MSYETLVYLHIDSEEFNKFIEELEKNYTSSNKLSACLLCWGFITSYQKKKHLEHSHYTMTPSFFKTKDQFIKIARLHGKTKDNDT